MNSILAIFPYRHQGTWVFDDETVGLRQEPFVAGADAMIDRMVADLPGAASGFRLVFSADPFPGHQYELEWLRGEFDGNWYRCQELDMEGWLCPALFKYFDNAPDHIYVRAEPKKA